VSATPVQPLLVQVRVVLHLVHADGRHAQRDRLGQASRREVRHAAVPDRTFVDQPRHGGERRRHGNIGVGPMDQEQVEVVGTQFAKRIVRHREDVVVSEPVGAHLGGQEEVGARHDPGAQGCADGRLVLVGRRGVDVPVATFERRLHGLAALVAP
jgi:hypothetical protein